MRGMWLLGRGWIGGRVEAADRSAAEVVGSVRWAVDAGFVGPGAVGRLVGSSPDLLVLVGGMSVRDGVSVGVKDGVCVGVRVDVEVCVVVADGVKVNVAVGESVTVGVNVAEDVGSGLFVTVVVPLPVFGISRSAS